MLAGCDDGRSRTEGGIGDRADRGRLDGGLDMAPDAGPLDRGLDAAPIDDAAPLDARFDVGPDLDAAPDGQLEPDADPGPVPDGGPTGRFVVGMARAADGISEVTVRAGGVVTRAAADGRFRLGPLEADEIVLRFSAPDHQTEEISLALPDPGDTPLPEPMVLYRGVRIGEAATGRLIFRFDEEWFLWEVDDRLLATPTPELDVRVLAPEQHEVFLGFAADGDAVFTRRRTMPGIAGDIDQRPLDGSPATPLFVEAQPWVREVGPYRLAMVETREALSRLEATRTGEEPRALATGVPWLLVTTLADDQVAWAAGEAGDFGVFVAALDGGAPIQVSPPDGPTADAFLLTTPDRRGLVWISPTGALWRWPGEGAAERLADDVATSPRPRLLRDGRVLFARREGAQASFHLWTPDGTRRVVDGARPSPALLIGETLYADRPEAGLWSGELAGPDGQHVLDPPVETFMSSGGGVLALIDGAAWRYRPDTGAEALGADGLTQLGFAPLGGTAWQAETGRLWFVPGPGVPGEATVIAEADRPGRINAPGGGAIYALNGGDIWARVPLPPGDGAPVRFDRPLASLITVGADGLLGQDADAALWAIDPHTGASVGWALNVDDVQTSARNGWVAYTCDRGTFLAPWPAVE